MRSTRFAVSTHVLAVLAEHSGDSIPSEMLAKSVGTSAAVIRQLLSRLRKAGLVESVLGPGGGIQLARAAGDISLRAVYDAVEDQELIQTHRCQPSQDCYIGRHILDVLVPIIDDADEALRSELAEYSIADIARRLRRKKKQSRAKND